MRVGRSGDAGHHGNVTKPRSLVSLVSAWRRNWHYLCGRIERVETGELVETANIHAVFMHVAENMAGWQKRLGEYPTLSAIACWSGLWRAEPYKNIRNGRRRRRVFRGSAGGIPRRDKRDLRR